MHTDTHLPAGDPTSPLDLRLAAALRRAVGADAVITDPGALIVYESDGLTAHRATPRAVVLPRSTAEVAAVVRLLAGAGVPFVARGAGTGLSGGALALEGAVVISLARMDRILELDPANRRAVVEPGVVNAALSRATSSYGLYYAPDPSSQSACTIGGNVAENAGGPHCLKYGVTTNHVTGIVVVLPDGEIVELGGGGGEPVGYDLVGLFVGSEGTFGIATEIEVRLLPLPEGVETLLALFDHVEEASDAVSAIIAAGLLPAALELIDRETIRAVEASIFAAGLPTDLGAALVIEFDGARAGLAADAARASSLCLEAGAREVRQARDPAERERLWQARKKAFGAMGRLAPDLLVQDAVVPRTRLTEILHATYEIAARYELRISNVFHAGDGNLHPTILFDRRDADQVRRVEEASREIMHRCIEAGGTITGEHGVGLDKLAYMGLLHNDDALALMRDIRRVFDPAGLSNPGKLLPVQSCRELVGPAAWRAEDAGEGGMRYTPEPRIVGERPPDTIDYEPADLVISVGADMTLGELQDLLAAEGQWLPLDPPGGATTSLGAIISNASTGPLRLGYGTPRDHVLGLQVVTGAGRVVECGGKVMKNVAGYDLVKLIVGSRGTLGRITRVDLRLRALPECDRTMAFTASSAAPLMELTTGLAQARIDAVALELLSPAAWRELAPHARERGAPGGLAAEEVRATRRDPRHRPLPGGEGWVLLVRLQGNSAAVSAAEERSHEVADHLAGVSGMDSNSTIPAAELWARLGQLEGDAAFTARLADRPDALARTIQEALRLSGAGEDLPLVAHAGCGIVRVLALKPELAASWDTSLSEARMALEGRRGTLIVERSTQLSTLSSETVPSGPAHDEGPRDPMVSRLMEGIRRCFDPAGALTPRRARV
jgi:glycolate oxidase subunit GlcD